MYVCMYLDQIGILSAEENNVGYHNLVYWKFKVLSK